MLRDVIIIGGGISGLTAAIYLEEAGLKPLLIEATGRVGGRIKTDHYKGFLLDRGFQVLLTSYPEAKKLLDFEALNLQKFSPGALVLGENGEKNVVCDPFREPSKIFTSAFSSIGSIVDKFKILGLTQRLKKKSVESIFEGEDYSTLIYLRDNDFSEDIIEEFFIPFFSGIFLEPKLKTSRKMFEFLFKMFAEGYASIPELGMGQIPIQLKSQLNLTEIKFDERVTHIEGNKVFTNKNECYEAKKIIIATEAIGLVKQHKKEVNSKYHGTSVMYFSADKAPIKDKYVALNAKKNKIINNVSVPSNISSVYAPKGKHLIALSTVGLATDSQAPYIAQIKAEMSEWFGEQVNQWELLKTFHIPYSLPSQEKVIYDIAPEKMIIDDYLILCGDHLSNSSINAAMKSGRLAAEIIIKNIKK
jgi:phytoene dehydrogenase-like protein